MRDAFFCSARQNREVPLKFGNITCLDCGVGIPSFPFKHHHQFPATWLLMVRKVEKGILGSEPKLQASEPLLTFVFFYIMQLL